MIAFKKEYGAGKAGEAVVAGIEPPKKKDEAAQNIETATQTIPKQVEQQSHRTDKKKKKKSEVPEKVGDAGEGNPMFTLAELEQGATDPTGKKYVVVRQSFLTSLRHYAAGQAPDELNQKDLVTLPSEVVH